MVSQVASSVGEIRGLTIKNHLVYCGGVLRISLLHVPLAKGGNRLQAEGDSGGNHPQEAGEFGDNKKRGRDAGETSACTLG